MENTENEHAKELIISIICAAMETHYVDPNENFEEELQDEIGDFVAKIMLKDLQENDSKMEEFEDFLGEVFSDQKAAKSMAHEYLLKAPEESKVIAGTVIKRIMSFNDFESSKQLNFFNEYCAHYDVNKEKIDVKYAELYGDIVGDF